LADVASAGEGLRGDLVTLALQDGPLELQTPARLLSDARTGQTVKVQPLGRALVLEGRFEGEMRRVELGK
jgi:flagella basal body P-ring formation protein FlgA